MKTGTRPNEPRTRYLGVFREVYNPERGTRKWRLNPLRFLLVGFAGLVVAYAIGVGAGYIWLQKVKNFPQVGVLDVALLRWRSIRRDISKEQFATAEKDWREGLSQPAFLSFVTAMRNDPDNTEGRIRAADFLVATGGSGRACDTLVEGVKRSSRTEALIKKTLDVMTTSGRDRQALALIHGELANELSGQYGPLLRAYEVLATLNIDGIAAAKTLLDQHPEAIRYPGSAHTRAQIIWESHERMRAIDILSQAVAANKTVYANYALLAQYQEAAGMAGDARDTAVAAVTNLPTEMGAHILLIAVLDPRNGQDAKVWDTAIKDFIARFGDSPGGLAALAEVASRKGWSEFVRGLYEVQLTRGKEVRLIALYYADSLVARGQLQGASLVLKDLALQYPDRGPLTVLLWQRQAEVASALGAVDDARDFARRLGSALSQEPDRLLLLRRRFEHLGYKEAAAELQHLDRSVTAVAKR